MTGLKRLAALATLIVGSVFFAGTFKLAPISTTLTEACRAAFYILCFGLLVLDWRNRKSHAQPEPSPAGSALWVVLATGAAAVGATLRSAHATSQYAVPISIVVVTAVLTVVVYRFASKNQNQIGEARFDTTSSGR